MQEEDEAAGRASPPAQNPATPPPAPPVWRADLGPRPIAALMPRVTRPAFKKRSPAGANLMADWPQIVGPVLAAQTIPQKLSAGTLTLGCAGPVAMELQYLAPQLIAKVNGALGQALVQRLRIVQAKMPPPVRKIPKPTPVALPAPIDAKIADVADPELRAALARLAQGVFRPKR
ncbi:DUF721 domain-containing protein [Roseomonas sp. USHLN139]|uniref:DUF721 domain-containing protein n=1 Tax=Roseomonas sp. USHLN139 TaxID=3081298 RepID=UPI003FA6C6B9